MKFSNFLFPESRDPAGDGRVIDETLREARLTDELGFDVVWLAEHHFDGICAYVDPVSFAAALAVATQRAKIGFAVAQMSLHHPIRMAEQLALIDHISKGRLIVGLGRGTAYNIYDYQGYGIDHTEAQARFEEAEAIMFKAWTGEAFEHHGRFWDLKLPMLRPRPYTQPHPYVIRSASSEHGMLEIARQGRPFMMNVQSNEVTRQRMELYRRTLREIGLDDAAVADNVDQCWVWRNVFVAETDAAGGTHRRAGVRGDARAALGDARARVSRTGGVDRADAGAGHRAGGADGGGALADLRLAGDGGGETGRGGGDRRRRRDHAVPAWPDGVRRRRAEPDAVHAESRAPP